MSIKKGLKIRLKYSHVFSSLGPVSGSTNSQVKVHR